jgi:hypothetical protein
MAKDSEVTVSGIRWSRMVKGQARQFDPYSIVGLG